MGSRGLRRRRGLDTCAISALCLRLCLGLGLGLKNKEIRTGGRLGESHDLPVRRTTERLANRRRRPSGGVGRPPALAPVGRV